MKRIVVDIDDTITIHNSNEDYANKIARVDIIKKLKVYQSLGYEIILFTSRNMKTHNGDIAKINKYTLPNLLKWLDNNDVSYDGIIMGKPWCGTMGFYIDDKAIRPDEFLSMSEEEIQSLIGNAEK